MRDLAGVSCKHVNVWGDLGEGELHWELVLDPLDHFGDMPQMVLDATGFAGTNAQATIETWQDGAKTWSSRPIAGDFLRQPISEPNNMEVWVGGALGVCEASGGSGCVWTYLEELTPRLASASPIQGKAGEMVSLTGGYSSSALLFHCAIIINMNGFQPAEVVQSVGVGYPPDACHSNVSGLFCSQAVALAPSRSSIVCPLEAQSVA